MVNKKKIHVILNINTFIYSFLLLQCLALNSTCHIFYMFQKTILSKKKNYLRINEFSNVFT